MSVQTGTNPKPCIARLGQTCPNAIRGEVHGDLDARALTVGRTALGALRFGAVAAAYLTLALAPLAYANHSHGWLLDLVHLVRLFGAVLSTLIVGGVVVGHLRSSTAGRTFVTVCGCAAMGHTD